MPQTSLDDKDLVFFFDDDEMGDTTITVDVILQSQNWDNVNTHQSFQIDIKPRDTTTYAPYFDVSDSSILDQKVAEGQAWAMTIPKAKHDAGKGMVYRVELGPAVLFLLYDPVAMRVTLPANSKLAAAGIYPITVSVTDEDGVSAESPLSIQLTILEPVDLSYF